jgi:hypothetical protein
MPGPLAEAGLNGKQAINIPAPEAIKARASRVMVGS